MRNEKRISGKPGRAPINPMTGVPNRLATPDVGDGFSASGGPSASGGTTAADRVPAASGSFAASGAHAAGGAAAADGAHAASGSPAAGRSTASVGSPAAERPAASTQLAQAPDARPAFTTSNDSIDELLDKLRTVLDSRLLSIIVFALTSFVVVARESFPLFLVVLVVGYALIDRFLTVRRAVTLGGSAWFSIVFIGDLLTMGVGTMYVDIDYLFMFCGFLLALAVCGVFFAGRSFYYMGYDRGQLIADRAIAKHLVDRLIDNPENVDNIDGTYLEVEGAINRVRDRERQVADALRDEARRKDDLVTYLAHDLKTPLASVVGYLSLLEEAADLPAEQRVRFTGVALDKAHRLDALIEEFFDITRFDFHDIVLTRGYVDLSLLLAQVADEFYPTLSAQSKQVEVEAPPSLTVLIDGDKMARVFNNVMKNAIAYSYEGSTIRIKAEEGDGAVCVRFENQGDPIPAPKLGVIFEKFYRLDAARATNRGGAGLGLAIAKEIVTAHGGTISCASTPEATVFTITLPAVR
ncbi:MAG: HAMP domain-containing sensor histidine kinase [Coriobacteriaceae bacterium]|nr:HAMP domain-containing sensor histidine kinase [Coriobacteriaceae bacterium]